MSRPRRCVVAVLVALACSPGPDEAALDSPTAAAFVTRDIVAHTLRLLDHQLAREEQEAAARRGPQPADLDERALGLLGLAAGRDADMARIALDEVRELGPAAVPVLAEVLGDVDRGEAERAAAARLLGALDDAAAAEALLQVLEGPASGWLQAHCAWQLGATTQDWVLPRLLLRLKYETDAQSVIWIARTLAKFENYAGLEGLSTVFESGDEQARADADAVAAEIVAWTGLEFEELRRGWRSGALGLPAEGSLPATRRQIETWRLISALAEWQLRGVDDARFVLARMGPWTARCLAVALGDENGYVRLHSGQCLERMGPRGRDAGPALVAALEDPHQAAQAALALGSVSAGAGAGAAAAELATGALIPRLAPGNDLALRVAAARALGTVGDEAARSPLRALLDEDGAIDLRAAAAEGLVRLGPGPEDAAAVRLLIALMDDAEFDPAVAERALEAWLRVLANPAADEGPAAEETATAEVWRRWRELGANTAEQAMPAVDALRARRTGRGALVSAHLADLLATR